MLCSYGNPVVPRHPFCLETAPYLILIEPPLSLSFLLTPNTVLFSFPSFSYTFPLFLPPLPAPSTQQMNQPAQVLICAPATCQRPPWCPAAWVRRLPWSPAPPPPPSPSPPLGSSHTTAVSAPPSPSSPPHSQLHAAQKYFTNLLVDIKFIF